MTKADIVEITYGKAGLSKKDVAEVVDFLFETIKEELEENDIVKDIRLW